MNGLSNPLAARGMRPIADLAANRPHGDRLRYLAGCRCFDCRRANSAYEASRKVARAAGEGNGIVSAAAARAHMKTLSAQGVGRRSVRAACDVADSVLSEIITGRKTQIRASTERAILAVTKDAAGDRALVPAKATWKLLEQLIADGYTKSELARRLGNKSPALQLKRDFVTVRNAYLVERLFEQLKFECAKPTTKLLGKLRDEGYTQHQVEQRLAILATELGEKVPTLVPNKQGRISTKAADLVEQLYREMTT
jgi:urease accessory protein UreE